MSDGENKSYKKVEVVGTSRDSVTDAIETAIDRGTETLKNLDWYELEEIRGRIEDGELVHQAAVRIGFRLE